MSRTFFLVCWIVLIMRLSVVLISRDPHNFSKHFKQTVGINKKKKIKLKIRFTWNAIVLPGKGSYHVRFDVEKTALKAAAARDAEVRSTTTSKTRFIFTLL